MMHPSALEGRRSVFSQAARSVGKGRTNLFLRAYKTLSLLRITVDVDIMCVSSDAQMVKGKCRR